MNSITLAPADDFLHDSDSFGNGLEDAEVQDTLKVAISKGFGTSVHAELNLGALLGADV